MQTRTTPQIQTQIGCDPELFLFDNKLQRIVPAIGKIGGSKQEPLKLKCGGMVQLDGTVLEFGTKPVDTGGLMFSEAIQESINEIRTKLHNRFHGRYDLRCGALAGYSAEDISENHTGFDVGCSPQFRMTGKTSLAVVPMSVSTLSRSKVPVGGHIHFGFGCNLELTDPVLLATIKSTLDMMSRMDLISILLFDTGNDEVEIRKHILGLRNRTVIRPKPYGFELRNMSSYWLADRTIPDLISNIVQHLRDYMINREYSTLQRGVTLSSVLRAKYRKINATCSKLDPKYQKTMPLDF
jgi:hypothetical protein